ncbi:cyclic nucleotide-binding domain-containing protein [Limisalsivibrio acetivorans]|uniref:cyclic nucleotide-binding domain-containing protein n=1 Tax=Limisalsivibrio acetivorans TaxID=1304888 RepID=UPI0003B404A5|nr:cyclic nucleotide-binding domain-containing protein [Limisalsivibrio acetivorans]
MADEGHVKASGEILSFLVKNGRKLSYSPGDVVLRQGEHSNYVCIIMSGEAEVVRHDSSGGSVSIATLERGAVLGEMGSFLDNRRTADVVALTPMELLVFQNHTFLKALRDVPELAERIMRNFAQRINSINEELSGVRRSKLLYAVSLLIYENMENPHSLSERVTISYDDAFFSYGLRQGKLLDGLVILSESGAVSGIAEVSKGGFISGERINDEAGLSAPKSSVTLTVDVPALKASLKGLAKF